LVLGAPGARPTKKGRCIVNWLRFKNLGAYLFALALACSAGDAWGAENTGRRRERITLSFAAGRFIEARAAGDNSARSANNKRKRRAQRRRSSTPVRFSPVPRRWYSAPSRPRFYSPDNYPAPAARRNPPVGAGLARGNFASGPGRNSALPSLSPRTRAGRAPIRNGGRGRTTHKRRGLSFWFFTSECRGLPGSNRSRGEQAYRAEWGPKRAGGGAWP
jgi:hypothetical protein